MLEFGDSSGAVFFKAVLLVAASSVAAGRSCSQLPSIF